MAVKDNASQKINFMVGKLTASASSLNLFKLIALREGVSLHSYPEYPLTTIYTHYPSYVELPF